MKLDFAFLADAAEVVNGKLYVMGGSFDTLWAKTMPLIHPRLSLVLKLQFTPSELDRNHKLEITLINADGQKIANVTGDIQPGKNPKTPSGYPHNFISVVNFNNLQLKVHGDYSFEILANNTSLVSLPLRVSPVA